MRSARGGWVVGAWLGLGLGPTGACRDDTPAVGGGEATTEATTAAASTSEAAPADDTGPSPTGDGDGSDGSDGGGPPPPPAACAAGVPIPASPQPPGDPEAGYHALLEAGYVTCGIPYPLFSLVQPLLGTFADEPPLPGRTGKNAEVPYSWTVHPGPSGAEIVSLNCLECHAGEFNGELMIGLGRADADYTSSLGGALAQIPIQPIPIPGLEELTTSMPRSAGR